MARQRRAYTAPRYRVKTDHLIEDQRQRVQALQDILEETNGPNIESVSDALHDLEDSIKHAESEVATLGPALEQCKSDLAGLTTATDITEALSELKNKVGRTEEGVAAFLPALDKYKAELMHLAKAGTGSEAQGGE